MRKSKYIFLILSLLYVLIYILNILHIVTIDENIMLGLTASAFFMSLSDVCNNILICRITRNELGYICYLTSNTLQEYISSGITETSLVNVRNLKNNVERLVPNYKKKIHPNKFYMSMINKILSTMGNVCFVLSITFFVLTPYLAVIVNQQISICLTLLAFSTMCFNIFITEKTGDYLERKNNFMNNTQILIQSFSPGFIEFLNRCLFFENGSDN